MPTEVVDGEDVGARLGRGADELRGRDLGELERPQRGTEPAHRGARDLPRRPVARVSQGHRGMVEVRRQPGPERRSPQLGGRGERGLGERRDRGFDELGATRRRLVGRDRAGHLDDGLLGQPGELLDGVAVLDDDLGQARPVAQDEERDAREDAAPVDPAGERGALTGLHGREVAGQHARSGGRELGWLHSVHLQRVGAPEVWAMGNVAVPPHLRRRGSRTASGRARLRIVRPVVAVPATLPPSKERSVRFSVTR